MADQLDAADAVLAVDYRDAQRLRGQLAGRLLACFADADVLALPTTATVAPTVEDAHRHLMSLAGNAIPWSLVGFPAMSAPVGLVDGLPVGLQLVAPSPGGPALAAGLAVERRWASSPDPTRRHSPADPSRRRPPGALGAQRRGERAAASAPLPSS